MDAAGKALDYTCEQDDDAIDLARPLKPGSQFKFSIDWWYNINDRMKDGGRSGYEYFEEEDNYIYTIALFYLAWSCTATTTGGRTSSSCSGESTLNFGDYHVELTVPSDNIVASTGT